MGKTRSSGARGYVESAANRKWRREQKPGAIMKPSTFKRIASEAGGGEKGKRIAGAAYWNTEEKKYHDRKKKKK